MDEPDIPLLERPYSERQLIVIGGRPPAIARGRLAADQLGRDLGSPLAPAADETRNARPGAAKALRVVGNALVRHAIGSLLPTKTLELGAEIIIGALGKETVGAKPAESANDERATTNSHGQPEITFLDRREAASITFPPGHPRQNLVYVGHPTVPNLYYTMADFHRVIFEHKFCEAITLLMNLGARAIRVEHLNGWSKEFMARIAVPLPMAEAGLEAGSGKSGVRSLLYEASLGGTPEPRVPDGLVWYGHEPTWRSVVDGRLKFGLERFHLTVSYEDDFGINAGLRAAVGMVGLDLGGRFESHQSTIWRIEGSFA